MNLKYRILYNWNAFRVIRLVLGIMIAVQSLPAGEYLMATIGAAFSLLALFDMGCSSGACTPTRNYDRTTGNIKNTKYEEVGNS